MNTIFFAVLQNNAGKKIDVINLIEGDQQVKELYNWAIDARNAFDKMGDGQYVLIDLKMIKDDQRTERTSE
jgi:hypothetical protein